jgi:hypothetical protein
VTRRDNGLARTSPSTAFHDTLGIGGGVTYYLPRWSRWTARATCPNRPSCQRANTGLGSGGVRRRTRLRRRRRQPARHRRHLHRATARMGRRGRRRQAAAWPATGVLRDGQDTGIVAARPRSSHRGTGWSPITPIVYKPGGPGTNAGNESPAKPPALSVERRWLDPCKASGPRAALVCRPPCESNGRTRPRCRWSGAPPADACPPIGTANRVFRGGHPRRGRPAITSLCLGQPELDAGDGVRSLPQSGRTTVDGGTLTLGQSGVARQPWPSRPATPGRLPAATAGPRTLTAPGVPTWLVVTEPDLLDAVVTWEPVHRHRRQRPEGLSGRRWHCGGRRNALNSYTGRPSTDKSDASLTGPPDEHAHVPFTVAGGGLRRGHASRAVRRSWNIVAHRARAVPSSAPDGGVECLSERR